MALVEDIKVKIDASELEPVIEYVRALESRVMQLEAQVAQLQKVVNDPLSQGYVRGGGNLIDRNVCAQSKCENCGHRGLGYEPYTRNDPKSYRAIALCPSCGFRNEF